MGGQVERVARRALVPYGFGLERVLGHLFEDGPWWRNAPSDTRPRLRAALADARSGEPCSVTLPVVADDGERHEIDVSISRVGGRGPDAFLLIVGTDVTAARRRERARRGRTRGLSAASGIVTWRVDAAARRVSAEPELARLHGLPAEPGASSIPIDDYVARLHRDDARRVLRALDRSLGTGESFVSTYRVHGDDGTVQWLIARGDAERDEAGLVSHLSGITLDVTPQRAAVEALEANEARYRRLFESTREGFCVLEPIRGPEGTVVDARYAEVNPAFERQSGLEDIEGRRVSEVLPGLELVWMKHIVHVVESGEAASCTEYVGDLGGWFEASFSPIDRGGGRAEDGRRVGCLCRDVTVARRDAERLRRLAGQLAEEARRKNAFLATLAHELRNPLAPVRHALELLRDVGDAREHERLREMMERQIAHTSRLVDDLLDISRINHDKLVLREGRAKADELVASAIEAGRPLLDSRHHTLTTTLPEPALALRLDPTRIAQALTNLVLNAARYTAEGGHVEVRVERGAEHVRFVVADDGRGLDADSCERVFEMFAQASGAGRHRHGGLGLGLTLARRFVEMHGGTLVARSAGLGHGCTFTLSLPLARLVVPDPKVPSERRAPAAMPSASRAAGSRRPSVLVVDDNRDAADTLARLLRARGLEVVTAYAGLEALARTGESDFDVLVLDIGMPDIDGREVAERYRAGGGRATLVALTGWGTEEDIARSHAAGFDHHLTKPITAGALLEVLHDTVPV